MAMVKQTHNRRRPVFSLPQFLVLAGVSVALVLALGLDAGITENRAPRPQEAAMSMRLAEERERNRQLKITLTYVHSDDYVEYYARNEGGMILPGEKRVVPIFDPPQPTPTPVPPPIIAVSAPTSPFEAWWMLFFDSPSPGR